MAQADRKIEVGTVYRIDGPVEVKVPHWFKSRLVYGDLVLCVGRTAQGTQSLLLDLHDGEVSVVGIDEAGEPTLTMVTAPGPMTQVWTPTRKEMLSLQRGDVLKGTAVTTLAAAQVQGRAANGQRASYIPAPVEG
jgi:hypothetical protein